MMWIITKSHLESLESESVTCPEARGRHSSVMLPGEAHSVFPHGYQALSLLQCVAMRCRTHCSPTDIKLAVCSPPVVPPQLKLRVDLGIDSHTNIFLLLLVNIFPAHRCGSRIFLDRAPCVEKPPFPRAHISGACRKFVMTQSDTSQCEWLMHDSMI